MIDAARSLWASSTGQTFLKYLAVGGISAVTDWVAFAALVYGLHLHYLVAGTASFFVATLVNYILSVVWVFHGGRHARHLEIAYVYLASAVGLAINLAVLAGLYEYLGMHVIIAKILATGSAFVWNFGARFFWIFHRRQTEI